MSLWKVAWRSIQQRSLASGLTAFAMALGVALVVAVLVIYSVIDQSFKRGAQGYDLIVGPPKAAALPLVLSTVFHVDMNQPLGTIPYSYYEEFISGRFAPAIDAAVPIALGHAYKGCPAVATLPSMFQELTYRAGEHYKFTAGRNFDYDAPYEAVIGSVAAAKTGLKVGDKFRPVALATEVGHGGAEGHDEFEVVGILDHTGTPNDRAVFMNLEGFFLCPAHQAGPSQEEVFLGGSEKPETAADDTADDKQAAEQKPVAAVDADHDHADHDHADADHDHDHADHDHADHDEAAEGEGHEHHHHVRALSAILVATNMTERPQLAMALPEIINRDNVAQAVQPAQVIELFFENIVGDVQKLLLVLAVLVVVVAGISILVSIYNSMNDRRHEIAVMRALGASRSTVMAIILLESILLSLGGGLLGVLLGHGLTGALSPMIADRLGVRISGLDFQLIELVLIPGLVVLATLVGYLPALVAYRTDVAKSLVTSA